MWLQIIHIRIFYAKYKPLINVNFKLLNSHILYNFLYKRSFIHQKKLSNPLRLLSLSIYYNLKS